MKNEEKQIKEVILDLFSDLEIEAKPEVIFEEDVYKIQLESDQTAVVIGFHGENLRAIQTIASFLVHQKLGQWVKLQINIGDYLQKREEQLKKLALNLAMKAKFSKETQMVPNLSPTERRLIHLILAENPDVYTESEGEGKLRCLTIKPKSK